MDAAARCRRLVRLLVTEQELLAALTELAAEMQQELLTSDFTGLTRTSEQMMAVAASLAEAEIQREAAMAELGVRTLIEAAEFARRCGEAGLEEARQRLAESAARFRDLQERNAALILQATRLRERWVNLLAGLGSPGYDASGRNERHQARRLVSRSA